jgi:hypothetical protein
MQANGRRNAGPLAERFREMCVTERPLLTSFLRSAFEHQNWALTEFQVSIKEVTLFFTVVFMTMRILAKTVDIRGCPTIFLCHALLLFYITIHLNNVNISVDANARLLMTSLVLSLLLFASLSLCVSLRLLLRRVQYLGSLHKRTGVESQPLHLKRISVTFDVAVTLLRVSHISISAVFVCLYPLERLLDVRSWKSSSRPSFLPSSSTKNSTCPSWSTTYYISLLLTSFSLVRRK